MEGLAYQSKYTNSWALIIGINNYGSVAPLDYAKNDATAIATILEKRFGFPKENVLLLLDQDASMAAIRKSFMEFADQKRIQPDDRLLVFFAGHGLTVPGKRGEVGFLVPSDGSAENLDTLIRWDELTRNADLIPAKHIFFLMDACYGGLALQRSPSFGSMRFLGDMLRRYARQVLTAGKADEPVADGNGTRPGHSIFTAHVLDALEGAAAAQEGIITASGVMAYVYDKVAKDQYSHQTPHYGFIDGDGDFVFDLTALEKLRGAAGGPSNGDPDGRGGEEDILVNTSPEIPTVMDTRNPVSERMKQLLSDKANKIKLFDYVNAHVRKFLAETDLRYFPVQDQSIGKEEFVARIHKYEELLVDLQNIVILLAEWGDSDQLSVLEKVFARLAEADKGTSGLVKWLHLTWYPLYVLMYSAGITALSSRNYGVLRIIFELPVQNEISGKRQPLIVPVSVNMVDLHDQFKWLPGHERNHVPISEYLFKLLQPTLEDALFVGRGYEALFDEFEILKALVFVDVLDREWGPPGRFAWKRQRGGSDDPFQHLVDDAKKQGNEWPIIRLGFFEGSIDKFTADVDRFEAVLDRMPFF